MLIERHISKKLKSLARKFPVVALIGPRQSGKSTLAKMAFPKMPYVSLENPDIRERAETDPRHFLEQYMGGAILDEVQRVPHLFSYLQEIVDQSPRPGRFILTGSQNFLMLDKVTQSLAGRVSVLRLLPFSLDELAQISSPKSLNNVLYQGSYPRLHEKRMGASDFYPSYITTYLERDVRKIKNIGNLSTFQRFLRICASQTGQLLNLSSLANDCGVNHKTIRSWISVLEASFIIFLLQPHFNNFKKRLVKMPKLYFYDTGLACSLLGIEKAVQLDTHPLRGALFETFVLSELVKMRSNAVLPSNCYFWRDKTGHEVDVIVDRGATLLPIEIKSGITLSAESLKNIHYWGRLSKRQKHTAYLVFGGTEGFNSQGVKVLGWRNISSIPLS